MLFRTALTVLTVITAVPAHGVSHLAAGVSAHTGILLVHEGHTGEAQASGTVNSVDVGKHSVNVSHTPIRALRWPAMTMDFPVDPAVDLAAVKPGMKISFSLVRGKDGTYEMHGLRAADAN